MEDDSESLTPVINVILKLGEKIETLEDQLNCLRFAVRLAVSESEYAHIITTALLAHSDEYAPLLAQFLDKGE